MDLEIIIPSEVRERQISYSISEIRFHLYVESNLKNDAKELICKTNKHFTTNLMVTIGEINGGGRNWEGRKNIYILLYKIDDYKIDD